LKKGYIILLFWLTLVPLTGCWDRVELNDLAIVSGVGIDQKDKDTLELTAEVMVPKALGGGQSPGGGGNQQPTIIRSGVGRTLTEAISDLQEHLPRRVFWGHTKVIVIGEKLAKKGIHEPLDFFTRYYSTRLQVEVFISEGKAKDVMATFPPLERSSTEVLRELAKIDVLMSTTLKDVLQMVSGEASAAAIPMVAILPPEEGKSKQETIAYIKRTAIFKEDRMIGSIDNYLTRGLLWFRNKINQAFVTVNLGEEQGYVSAALTWSHSELIPKIEDGKWSILVKAVSNDDIIMNVTHMNMMDVDLTKRIQRELEKEVSLRMESVLKKIQKEMKVDVLGFSEAFHQAYPAEWKKAKDHWHEIFPTVDVTYKIRVNVLRPGLTTQPQGVPAKEVKKK